MNILDAIEAEAKGKAEVTFANFNNLPEAARLEIAYLGLAYNAWVHYAGKEDELNKARQSEQVHLRQSNLYNLDGHLYTWAVTAELAKLASVFGIFNN